MIYFSLISILNDVILNKRTSLTDKEALKDAKRSLSVMLNDFITQQRSTNNVNVYYTE